MTDPLFGNRIESFRVELLDYQDNIIGDLDGVIGGELSWNDNAPIPGGGSLDLTDLGQDIDFSSNRLRPYLRLAVPKREGLVPQPGTPVWTEERRNLAINPLAIGGAEGATVPTYTALTRQNGLAVRSGTAYSANAPAPLGSTVWIRARVRGLIAGTYTLQARETNAAGSFITPVAGSTSVTLAVGEERDIIVTGVTSGVGGAGFRAHFTAGPLNGLALLGLQMEVGPDEPRDIFAGSTVSTDPALRYRWLGTVNASASVEERGSLSVPDPTIVPDTGPGFIEWPLGVYVMAAPSTEYSATGQRRTIDLVDKITVISDDRITETLQVAQGANIIAAVQQQILATGETRILATASTATLTNTMTWEPGTSRLRIINDLLSVAGYWSLSTDRSGQFLVQPYIAPADRPVAWSFEEGAASLHSPEWEHEMPLWEATNHVTFVSQENDAGQVWVATAIDDNPDSPTSTVNMKRVLNPIVEENVEASSQLDLQTQANRKLRDNSNVVGQISVNHAFIPVWYRDSVSFKSQGVDTKATIVEMSMRLEPGALVEARWRQA